LGYALGLLQKRVEVLGLDEFVGLQMLEGPGAAHRQAGRGRPALCVVELRGFEPLTPCMPLMRGWFKTPCNTSRVYITAQVRDAAEGWVVGRREATCSAVSGKFLARALYGSPWTPTPWSGALPTADWHLKCSAVLRRIGSSVVRKVMRQRRVG
jgi:hypothetical protein